MDNLCFENKEKTMCVNLPDVLFQEMIAICRVSFPLETGGVLIGRYSEDLHYANVNRITGPMKRSRLHYSSFFRSNYGLKEILDEEWNNGNY